MVAASEPSPAQLKATYDALAKEIGPKCELSIYVGVRWVKQALAASVSPRGYSTNGKTNESFSVAADTWADLEANVRAEWAKRSERNREQTLRDMALAIIRITAALGQCTDAALRADFDPVDVGRYGADAVALANDMADLGPFEIIATAGANARVA